MQRRNLPKAGDGPEPPRRGGKPRNAGDLVGEALRELGLPSRAAGARLRKAWDVAADPAWARDTRLRGLTGGVLEVSVSSSALQGELVGFHRERLLRVMRTALPDTPLIGLRFVVDPGDGGGR